MSKRKKILSWIFFLCMAAILVGSLALRILNVPLGPKLQVTERPAQPTTSETTAALQPAASPVPTALSSTCGGQGAITILVLGESSPEDYPPRGADAIRLVNVDYDANTVKILAFPPDLWVNTSQIPVVKSNGSTLTFTYFIAKSSLNSDERSKMAYGTNAMAQSLSNNFSLVPDNFLTIKQYSFKNLIDALGGLSITLPEAVDGTSSGFGYYNAGPQVMTGQRALDYVRILTGNTPKTLTEWERFDRQNQVLVAIFNDLTRPETLTKLPGIINDYYKVIVTDLSINQFRDLTCVMKEPGVKFEYVEFNPDLITSEQAGILIPDTKSVTRFLQGSFSP